MLYSSRDDIAIQVPVPKSKSVAERYYRDVAQKKLKKYIIRNDVQWQDFNMFVYSAHTSEIVYKKPLAQPSANASEVYPNQPTVTHSGSGFTDRISNHGDYYDGCKVTLTIWVGSISNNPRIYTPPAKIWVWGLLYFNCVVTLCTVSFPHGTVGWSAVYDCGISLSHSITFYLRFRPKMIPHCRAFTLVKSWKQNDKNVFANGFCIGNTDNYKLLVSMKG